MANQEVNLIFRLSGNAVTGLKQFNKEVESVGQSLNRFSQQASRVASSLTFLGGGIVGAFSLSLRTAREYSASVDKTLDSMNNTLVRLQVQIAEAVLPVVQRFANLLSNLLSWFNSLDPALKNNILQMTLLAGAWALFGGVITKVVALVARFAGVILSANPAIVAVVASVAGLAVVLNRLGVTMTDVINAFEIFFRMVVIGFNRVMRVVVMGIDVILKSVEKAVTGINYLVASVQKFTHIGSGEEWAVTKGIKDARNALSSFGRDLDLRADELQDGIQRIFQTGEGTASGGINDMMEQMRSLFSGGSFVEPLQKQFNMMEDMARGTASALQNTFQTLFFDAFSGQLKSAKEYFANFGQAILQILTQALAKMLLMKTVGKLFPGIGQFFHSGGQVQKAHSGYLASDEVPIIAQAGEGIISRRGMASLGGTGLNRINSGQGGGGGGVTININPVIQAWDAQDVYRNKNMISAVIAEGIRNNSEIRKIMKAYA